MSKEVKNVVVDVESTIKRINDLKAARLEVQAKNDEISVRQKDLSNAEVIYGVTSKEFLSAKNLFDLAFNELEDANKKVVELSFKKSELKPVLDELTKQFEDAIRKEQTSEYHIELATDVKDKDGNVLEKANGKKVFKQLLEYLNNNVSFTPKTAANLMVLVRNMEENKAWVNSKEFDNVIILRSASVLSLWRFIMDDLTGKGFYEARTFLECWANCGQSISKAVTEIQKSNKPTRLLGTNLDLVETEFNISEDDIKDEERVTTQEEVAPEVEE